MTSNLYASVAEFKDRYGIEDTERDFAIDRILEASSRWLDKTLGRRFYTTASDETRYYCAPACYWQVQTDDIISVTTLQTDNNGDGTYETTWVAGTDYWLGPINAQADGEPYTNINKSWWTGRYSFPTWENSVKVVGRFGYCTLANCPVNIRELTLIVAEIGARPIMDLAVAGVQSYKLGNELTVLAMQERQLPDYAKQLLQPYKRGVGFVG